MTNVNYIKRLVLLEVLASVLVLVLSGCRYGRFGSTAYDSTEDNMPELVIGSDNYEPYSYLDDYGQITGIDVDIAREACRRMGYRPVFRQIAWEKKDELLNRGELDCLWGSFTMTGRESMYTWAGPYMTSRQVVVVRRGSGITDISMLEGKRIAVQATTKPEAILLNSEAYGKQIPKAGAVYSMSTMEELYASMRKGYTDAIAGHESAMNTFIGTNPNEYYKLPESLYVSELGVAFKKGGNEELAGKLTQVLRQMQDDGTIDDIAAKYGIYADTATGGSDEQQ